MTKKKEVKPKAPEYSFAMGSFKFKSFKDLWEHLQGKTSGFNRKPCHVLKDDEALMTFTVDLKMIPKGFGTSQFTLVWTPENMAQFNRLSEAAQSLNEHLPKFQRVGSTAKTAFDKELWYGHLKIADLYK